MAEEYTVQQGDSVPSIAVERGFFWKTLWNHENNAALRNKRKDPDILMPGDVLHIPDRQKKTETRGTESSHKFKVKGRKVKLKLTLLRQPKDSSPGQTAKEASETWRFVLPGRPDDKAEPMDFVPWEVHADGKLVDKGHTDGSGKLAVTLAANAKDGLLVVNRNKPDERMIPLNFRSMDPIEEPQGIAKRLNNLGFSCRTFQLSINHDVEYAIAGFQRREGMLIDGNLDSKVQERIKSVYGG
jgi:N-acetylmuramoyl-L-alanine amidase